MEKMEIELKIDEDFSIPSNICCYKKCQIQLQQLIGDGVFGKVFHGILRIAPIHDDGKQIQNLFHHLKNETNSKTPLSENEIQVAVKIPNKTKYDHYYSNHYNWSHRNEVLYEIQLLSKFNHKNLIKFVGMIENPSSLPWLIMEHMPNGNLQEYLKNQHQQILLQDDNNNQRFEFYSKTSHEIASGMNYLHNQQRIVHGDLHLQNCLVGVDETIKIGDFGQSFVVVNEEDVLQGPIGLHGRPSIKINYIEGGRWKAPETIPGPNYKSVFTRPGDVWCFGILLYELWNGGKCLPFNGLDDHQVLKAIVQRKDPFDYTSPSLHNIPADIVVLMMDCWNFSPNLRPTFVQILDLLSDDNIS